MLFAPAGPLFEQNNTGKTVVIHLHHSANIDREKLSIFFMHLTAHFSVPPRVTEHRSIFSQDDCFVPLLPRGPR